MRGCWAHVKCCQRPTGDLLAVADLTKLVMQFNLQWWIQIGLFPGPSTRDRKKEKKQLSHSHFPLKFWSCFVFSCFSYLLRITMIMIFDQLRAWGMRSWRRLAGASPTWPGSWADVFGDGVSWDQDFAWSQWLYWEKAAMDWYWLMVLYIYI